MRIRHLIATFSTWLTLASGLCGSTAPIGYSLAALPEPTTPGTNLAVSVTAMNSSDRTAEVAWPVTVAGSLFVANSRWDVTFTIESNQPGLQSLAPSMFTNRVYKVLLPPDTLVGVGFLELRLPDTPPTRVGLVIANAKSSVGQSTQPATVRPTNSLVYPEPAVNIISRAFAERIGPHEPIYFVYGPDDPAAKLQFSLKYKIMSLGHASRKWASRTIQFGYTQCSLWDIGAESSPFHDSSYMPELMLEALTPVSQREGHVNWLGLQMGYKHESNGRDGPLSRSIDIAQLRGGVAFGELDGWHLIVVPRIWAYLGTSDDNDDIDDYRGYGTLGVVLGRNDGPTLTVSSWSGKGFDHASIQIDLNVPVRMNLLDLKTYLLVQYFNGYGESLRDYKEKSETIRAGFSIVR